jgi:pimeloyl-ACP methyl ester carboxylesterase
VKPVVLIPGFTASDLAIISTGQPIWWDLSFAALTGLGAMRLDGSGLRPGPPDGQPVAAIVEPQHPWGNIRDILTSQLDPTQWAVTALSYDWRKELTTTAVFLANDIRQNVTLAEPVTLVAHSAGGLIALQAWAQLVATNDQAKVRRIITMGTPFQGSYWTIQWLTGVNATIQQLAAVDNAFQMLAGFPKELWTLPFLNALTLTWPAFYELFPSLLGSEAQTDPNRALLYNASNYPRLVNPSPDWLLYAQEDWQPTLVVPAAFPPSWVMTTVGGTGLSTPNTLLSSAVPISLTQLGTTMDGDGVVTRASATRSPGLSVTVEADHASMPLGLARTGQLRDLIIDPRGPLSPPPVPIVDKLPIPINVTAPPESDYLSGLVCIGGG